MNKIQQLTVKRIPYPFDNADLSELDLQVRTYNTLARQGIQTIYDLVLRLSNILNLRNIGEKSLDEIKDRLLAWVNENTLFLPCEDKPKFMADFWDAVVGEGDEDQKLIQYVPPLPGELLKGISGEKKITLEDLLWDMPDDMSKLPFDNAGIETLDLSPRTRQILLRNGVTTVYDLVMRITKLDEIYMMGPVAINEVRVKLNAWLGENTGEARQQAALAHSANVVMDMPHLAVRAKPSINDLFSSLNGRQREALFLSYGLETGHTMALLEASDLMGVTRERVRQLKAKALRTLKESTVRLKSLEFLETAAACIVRRGGVVSQTRLAEELKGDPVLCGFQAYGLLELFKDVDQSHLAVQLIFIPYIEAWTIPEYPCHMIEPAAAEMQKFIENSLGLDEWTEIYAALLKHEDLFILDENLASAIAICLEDFGILERACDGRWAVKGTRGHLRRDQLVDVLRRISQPAHFEEIAHVYQEIFPDENLGAHAIHTILSRYNDIFSRVGRGLYGLSEWGLGKDGTVANTARRILAEAGEPMSFPELRDQVRKFWQVQDFSIASAIQHDARFTKLSDGKYWLTEKGHAVEKIHKREDGGRRERLLEVMRSLRTAAHVNTITEKHNALFPDTPLTAAAVYTTFMGNSNLFIRVGTSSFGLTELYLDGDLDVASSKPRQQNRTDDLIHVMKSLDRPARVNEILEKYNHLFSEDPISDGYLRRLLSHYKDIFINSKKGYYDLASGLLDT